MSQLWHGFPRTPEGRRAAHDWLDSGEPHEDHLKAFYESPASTTGSYRGKQNKHGVRGLSYSEKTGRWTGEVYLRGDRKVFRSKDRFEVEMWLLNAHKADGAGIT